MTDHWSLARLKTLYDSGASLDEIACDPEIRADFLSGLETDTERVDQIRQLIDYLLRVGHLSPTKEGPRDQVEYKSVGSQNPNTAHQRNDFNYSLKDTSNYDQIVERYEQFIGASHRRRTYKQLCRRGRTETVVISDLHIPDERPDLIADVCTRHKGSRLVIAGDINDFQKYSRYDVEELDLPTLRDAFAQTDAVLAQLTEFFPEVIVMFGNHDLRLERKVRRFLGEDFAWMTSEFQRMVYERRHGVKVVSHVVDRVSGRPIDGLHYWYQIGDCLISHAERSGKSHLKGATDAHNFFYSYQWSNILPIKPFRVLLQAHCFSEDTEVLTRFGWRTFDQLSLGSEVLTYNLKTGASEWNSVQEIVHYDHYEELVQFKNEVADLLVTPEHTIVASNPHTTETIKFSRSEAKDWIGKKVKMPCGGENVNLDYEISDDLLRLMAWVITAGEYCKENLDIWIAKDEKRRVDLDRIVGICRSAGVPFSYYGESINRVTKPIKRRNSNTLSIRLLSSDFTRKIRKLLPDRKIDWWMLDLSHRQFLLFFKELMRYGTNNHAVGCSYRYLSKNEEEVDVLQALCAFNGYRSVKTHRSRQIPYWVLNICRCKTIVADGGTCVPYSGRVWCVRVENQTLFTRRNGKVIISGNTHKRGYVEHPITRVHCYEIGAMCDVQAYSIKNPRYGPIQNGYFHLVQYDGVTDLNESRLWILG